MSCHENIPDGDIAIDLLSHVAKYGKVEIDNEKHQSIVSKSILISAWFQVLSVFLILGLVFLWWFKKRK